jgi:N-methylhydantoinase A/oxoprolinase/acetone carboxylase beta subunit
MRGEGFSPEEIRFELELELNAPTLSAPVRITLPNPFIWPDRDWPAIIESAASRFDDDIGMEWHHLEISRVFLRAIAGVPHTEITLHRSEAPFEGAYKGRRPIYVGDERWMYADAYEWDLLSVPCVISGPSAIESQDTTVLVPPGTQIEIDSNYNGIIRERETQ